MRTKRAKATAAFLLAFSVLAAVVPLKAHAQEAQPGDACTGGQKNLSRWTGGPETSGTGNLLVCDGSTWQPILRYSSTGLLGVRSATTSTVTLSLGGTDALLLTAGTTAQRPGTPANGMIRYNTTNSRFEVYQAGSWLDLLAGSSTFLSLTDTPASYAGAANYYVRVNSGAAALEFTNQVVESLTGQPAPTAFALADLATVSIASAINTDTLVFDGTNWIRSSVATGAIDLPSGTTAQRPGSPTNGMIRYNSTTAKFEGYEAGAWVDMIGGSAQAAAPGRGIQFNSGNAFTASANLTFTSGGSLLTMGTYSGAGDTTLPTGAGTRMFFDPTKAAFRVGNVSGVQWNNASVGNYSVAMGNNTVASGGWSTAIGANTTASGAFSTAMGDTTTASGDDSTAMGWSTVASGGQSIAMGNRVVAGNGTAGSGFGTGSMALGLIDGAVGISAMSQVRGIQSMGIFMGDQDGLVMTANNTMGLFGGAMVIDPRVPASQLSARGVLDLGAATDALVLPLGATGQRPGSPVNGMIRYNSTTAKFEGYEAGAWVNMIGGGGGSPAGSDTQVQFNSGGSFGASGNFVWNNGTAKLTITGDIDYTGLLTDTSDRRLKENIVPLSDRGNVVDRLSAVGTYSFNMKDDPNKRIEFGVMAQELQPAFPELVRVNDDEMKSMSVNYIGLVPVLIEAVKEQQKQIDALKAEVEALREP